MRLFRMLLALGVIASFNAQSNAGVLSVGPFSGSLSETWESFNDYSTPSFHYESDPTSIMGGGASISNPLMVIYNTTSSSFGLGDSGTAQVSDGKNGMGINDGPSLTTISFTNPVTAFGAYWGEATFGGPNTVTVNFYDLSSNLIDTQSFTYDHESTADGILDWHGWSSSTGIAKITYSGDYVVIDGLQADVSAVPEPTSMTMLGLGVVGLFGYGIRKRKSVV